MNEKMMNEVKAAIKAEANGQNGTFGVEMFDEWFTGKVYANGTRVTGIASHGPADIISSQMSDEEIDIYQSEVQASIDIIEREIKSLDNETAKIDAKLKAEDEIADGEDQPKPKYVIDFEDTNRVFMVCTACGQDFSQSKYTKYQTLCPDCRHDSNLMVPKHTQVLDHLLLNGADSVINMAAIFNRHPSSIAGTITFLMKYHLITGGDGIWEATGKGRSWRKDAQ